MTELLKGSKFSQVLDWFVFKKKIAKSFFIETKQYSTIYWLCDAKCRVSTITLNVGSQLESIESGLEL